MSLNHVSSRQKINSPFHSFARVSDHEIEIIINCFIIACIHAILLGKGRFFSRSNSIVLLFWLPSNGVERGTITSNYHRTILRQAGFIGFQRRWFKSLALPNELFIRRLTDRLGSRKFTWNALPFGPIPWHRCISIFFSPLCASYLSFIILSSLLLS